MLVVIINSNMRGLVNRGLIEYFCNRVTIKKLVMVTKKMNKIYRIVKKIAINM